MQFISYIYNLYLVEMWEAPASSYVTGQELNSAWSQIFRVPEDDSEKNGRPARSLFSSFGHFAFGSAVNESIAGCDICRVASFASTPSHPLFDWILFLTSTLMCVSRTCILLYVHCTEIYSIFVQRYIISLYIRYIIPLYL